MEATANSNYVNIIYNCTSCNFNYLPYYSKFYQRQICQNIYEKVTKRKNIDLKIFENENSTTKADSKGVCPENYFTPDEEYCYKCDNENIGMPGCNGKCNFSLKRNNIILCESDCKQGYLESSPGICDSCNDINPGCAECYYENNNLPNYYGKRAREFKCYFCNSGYALSPQGKCFNCQSIISHCDKCKKNDATGEYKCTKCLKNYALDDSGDCERCVVTGAILNEKCVSCSDKNNGGVENCNFCQVNEEGNGVICKQCFAGYILSNTDNTCLSRNNNDLKQFYFCLELALQNGKYICTRCKPQYSLIKEGDESKCQYIPTLFDDNFRTFYYYHYYYDIFNQNFITFQTFAKNDYSYRQSIYLPCKEAINLGTKENPLYSCSKCYNVFDDEDYDNYYYNYNVDYGDYYYYYDIDSQYNYDYRGYQPTKIIENINNNSSICIKRNEDLENCTEAIYIISKGEQLYNCTKCSKDNHLILNSDLNIYYCGYDNTSSTICSVENCKSCVPNKYYFCQKCITSNYEVSQASGSCILKMEKEPDITWKDIYRLRMNGHKVINGFPYNGLTFKLRGITEDEISYGHSYLVYLTFKIKHGLRYLQEEENKHIPCICEVEEQVEKNNETANYVDYDCIGNETVPEDSELIGIQGENTNLNSELLEGKDLTKVDSIYNENNTVYFITNYDTLGNKSFYGKLSNFSFIGRLNKDNDDLVNNANLSIPMNEIEEKTICYFYKDNQLNASLDCSLQIKNQSNISYLTFDQGDLKIGNTNLYISKLDSYNISYIQEEEIYYPIINY